MRKAYTRVLALLLALAFSLSLCGCNQNAPPATQQGIVITPAPAAPYSAETLAYAEEVFYPLILRYAQGQGLFLTPSVKAHYRTVAAEIARITAKNPVKEALYTEALAAVALYGEAVVDELVAYAEGKGESLAETAVLYRALTALFDNKAVLGVFYELLLYSCDYRYRDAMEKYELYKREIFRKQAEAARAEKRVIQDSIGEETFSAILSGALVFGDLFFGGALEEESLSAFSDEEILAFIRTMELSEVRMESEGWALILEKAVPAAVGDNGAYVLRLLSAAKENGDLASVAAIANDVFALGCAVVSQLTAEEISLFRSGAHEAAIAGAAARFTDAQWESLSRIGALSLQKERYHALALELYGADYAAYAESLTPLTAAELRAGLEKETFYESLERFVFGISPALSYGMRK